MPCYRPQRRPFAAFLGRIVCAALAGLALQPPGAAGADDSGMRELSLEELGQLPAVVSSKFPSQLFDTPNGSFVFDENDIARLPVDSLPEMLRYAPGVHILRPSNGIWGLGVRGINSRFFNRVLFTVDEQNVYGTIFSGLFGSQHDLLMDDVASVEVAYGPGGGAWDNNGVNGMVNVLMKTAFETEGQLYRLQLGTEGRGVAGRIGWALNDNTSARVFVKANDRDASYTRFDYANDWQTARAGFRLDHRPSSRDLLSVSGEAFYSDLGYAYNLADFATGALDFTADSERLSGANAQLKWTRNSSDGSAYSVRSWFGYSDLDAAYAAFGIGTAGAEARARFAIGERHSLSLNAGGAFDEERTRSTLASDFTRKTLRSFVAYSGLQHEWQWLPERLRFSWGADFRHVDRGNSNTLSPNARLLYQIDDASRLWLSFSRANRSPPVSLSVIDSLRSGKALDAPILLPGAPDPIVVDRSLTDAESRTLLDEEKLDAIEAGYRRVFADERGSVTLNAFSYRYDEIIARLGLENRLVLDVETPYVSVRGGYDNLLEGRAYGFETSFSWLLNPANRLTLNYSRLADSFDPLVRSDNPFVSDSIAFSIDEFDHSSPGHLATLNLASAIASDWDLDTGWRYSSGYEFAKGYQPSIFQLDARLTWQQSENLTLSLVGRNLLDGYTQEARLKDFFGHWTEMKREAYLEITARF